jgi:hypothetical protein
LDLVWTVHVDDERASTAEKQDDFLSRVGRGIDIPMDGMRRDVEEITRTDDNIILFPWASFEASRS